MDTSLQVVSQGPLKTLPTIYTIAIDLGACYNLTESNPVVKDTRYIGHRIQINKVGMNLEASSPCYKVLTMQAGRKRKDMNGPSQL